MLCIDVSVLRERRVRPQDGEFSQHHHHNLFLLAIVPHDQMLFPFDQSHKDPEGH